MGYRKHWKNVVVGSLILGGTAISIVVISCFSEKHSDVSLKNFEILRIGVIDGVRLKSEAKCFEAHLEIADKASKILGEIKKTSTQMRNQLDEIKKDKKLKPQQKQLQITKIERKWKVESTEYNKQMRKIKELDNKLTNYIQDRLLQTVDIVARKMKIDIIINKGTQSTIHVFYNKQSIDITDIIINKMNKTIPAVNLKDFE